MEQLYCRLFLLLYCFLSAYFVPVGSTFVVAFLASSSLCCFSFFLDSKRFSGAAVFIFFIVGILVPAFSLFLPLILFDTFRHKNYWLCLFVLINLSAIAIRYSYSPMVLVMLGLLLCLLLNHLEQSYTTLFATHKHTIDASQELNFLLSQKNQALIKRQDYEIYTATLKERNRIAREIHDNVGHMLSRSILMVGAMKAVSSHQPNALPQSLALLDDTLNQAMNSIRESVHDLHDDSVNLREVTESLLSSFDFCPIYLDYDMSVSTPKEIKYSFIMITKEALSNIMKHSDASEVHLVMREHPGLYQMVIEDNGTKKPAPGAENSGIGLINMQERVHSLHGSIQFLNERGFRIFITIPKSQFFESEVS